MNKKTLVIYSHPRKDGHNGLFLKHIEKELKEKKIKYELIDLNSIKFNPVLSKEEHPLSGKKFVQKDAKKIQEKVKECDKLVFIYPIWWNSPPAIMKGFFDRVLSAGFAFRYKKIISKYGMPTGLLKGKKAAIFITSGSPKFFYWLVEGNRGKKLVAKDTLRFCGIRSKVWHFGHAQRVDDRARKKIPKLAKRGIKWLEK